ncbi:MAG: ATP-binding protein [Acidobacteria bacterium]|nr:ATP-binding protein [Acidobacteriota bacterium]
MTQRGIRREVVMLMTVRLAVSVALLGSAVLLQLRAPLVGESELLYGLIGSTFALSAVWAVTLRQAERRPWLVDLQLAFDTLTVSAFVWMTGGIASVLSSLYFLPIIGASTLRSRRSAVLMATFAAVLHAALVIMQYAVEQSPLWSLWPTGTSGAIPPAQVAGYTVAINTAGFFAVAWLSGSLAERVRRADVRLADASAEIADLQAFNQHVIDSLAMGLVTTDLAGRVLTFNQVAEAITGHAAQTARGGDVASLLQLPPPFAAKLGDLPARTSARADYRYTRADGTVVDLGLAATGLMTSAGHSGFLFTFQDTTAPRRLEREARVQHRMAAVGEMAAGIAHEIRNPLASMSGSIQVLRSELSLNPEQAQLMDIVLRESERLNTTIRSFLAYARPQRFNIGRIDVRSILQDAALLLRNSSEVGARHSLDVESPALPVWCEADEGQIRQIVWNLATNGLRAMPDGGRLLLSSHEGATQHEAVIVVQDEGVGIEDADLDAIFQPFHGSFAKGSGLGMAIVHRIVSDHGGEIRVTSNPGAGTTVEVRLPAREPAA